MAATETYTFEYFMPEVHLKTALLTFLTALVGFMSLLPRGSAGIHLVLFLAFAASAFFAFLGFSKIMQWTRKTVLIISPEGLTDNRFGQATIPWAAIERIDLAPPIENNGWQAEQSRFLFRGMLRLFIASRIYGTVTIPGSPTLTEHRDKRRIKLWLRSGTHIEQTTPAARLRIRDKADGTQHVYIATADLNVTREELLALIVDFHAQYGSMAQGQPATA
ncbi:hypothetical protein [Rhizobium hainanense]|uniref:PH domain-containing protein n=1 Tax=Rhizobium hainanense TaxID=52131 RepID=A0A1C3UKF9_9HYPH|nr:hypothetical protein [Rhizobium hainanense]SCB15942.1 hypothetical protein GA0061100_102479 [Rhizobium hainanense]